MTNKRIWLIVALLALAVAIPACQTAGRKVYTALWTLETSVSDATSAYFQLVAAGQLKTNSVPAVSRKFNIFQASMTVAVALAMGNSNAPASDDLTALGGSVLGEIKRAQTEDKR